MAFSGPTSYKQAKDKGGQVRKGEKGMPVIFWKLYECEDRKTGEVKNLPVLRYYTVFNLDQIDGIDAPDAPEIVNYDFEPIEEAERIINDMPNRPEIVIGGTRAAYRPMSDTVTLPPPELFREPSRYYSTAFHELTHATGHEKRLNRRPSTEVRHFGDREYSKEELVAEMGAAFLSSACRLQHILIEHQAAYISGWLQVLKGSPKMVIQAAAQAQKATDYILGRKFED